MANKLVTIMNEIVLKKKKEEEICSKSVNRITMKNVRMMLTSIKTANGDKIMTTKTINYDNKTSVILFVTC